VRSIIGRFLEHSRIFYFADGSADPLEGQFFIGSADWMYRNLSHRVEVVTPVTAPHARERLREILDVALQDRRQAWRMRTDGRYERMTPADGSDADDTGTHRTLMEATKRRSRRMG
jgi:polyphosphate kinase